MKPLEGITVIDLSRFLAGPYCTSMLADLGANVIKIESTHGDDSRHIGPFVNGESIYFSMLNRGKKSISLDLKSAGGLDAFHKLCAKADVLIENFRPGVTSRLGIDSDTLRKRNTSLIYCSISGFGQSGSMSNKPAYDIIAQALSGIMASTGPEGGAPTRVGESFGDIAAGMFSSWAICAALFNRERDPKKAGCYLDVSMLDCLFTMQVTNLAQFIANGQAPKPIGNRHPLSAPFDSFQAQDGQVVIAVANNSLFSRLCHCMEMMTLIEDKRFSTDEQRGINHSALKELIESWTSARSVSEVCRQLDAVGVPASPIWNIEQLVESQHAEERGLLQPLCSWHTPTQPIFFNGHKLFNNSPSPVLGADNNILDEII